MAKTAISNSVYIKLTYIIHKQLMNNQIPKLLFKYLDVKGAKAFLQHGISFSEATSFSDAAEFTFEYNNLDFASVNALLPEYRAKLGISDADLYRSQHDPTFEKTPICTTIRALMHEENYRTGNLERIIRDSCIEQIKFIKSEFAVCSLTTKENYFKMWDCYADSCKGVMLSIELPSNYTDVVIRPIQYSSKPIKLNIFDILNPNMVYKIIFNKRRSYAWEHEFRAVIPFRVMEFGEIAHQIHISGTNGRKYLYDRYLPFYLKHIDFGKNCSRQDRYELTRLVELRWAEAKKMASDENFIFKIEH